MAIIDVGEAMYNVMKMFKQLVGNHEVKLETENESGSDAKGVKQESLNGNLLCFHFLSFCSLCRFALRSMILLRIMREDL